MVLRLATAKTLSGDFVHFGIRKPLIDGDNGCSGFHKQDDGWIEIGRRKCVSAWRCVGWLIGGWHGQAVVLDRGGGASVGVQCVGCFKSRGGRLTREGAAGVHHTIPNTGTYICPKTPPPIYGWDERADS